MDLGNHIKTVLKKQGRNAVWLAERIPCERSNVYNIFRRKSIDVNLLVSLSNIMQHDFFADLSEEWRRGNLKE